MAPFRTTLVLALGVAALSARVHGQAPATASAPAPYSQFALPDVGGSLRYSLTASESFLTGYNGTTGSGVHTYTNLSGNLGYLSRSVTHPFSAVYSGGYLIGGSTFPSYPYQSLTLSQGYTTRNWSFLVADAVSYLPQTPIGSLSGVPGAGDLNVPAVSVTTAPALGILTTYATRVGNVVSGTASRKFTPATSLGFTGSYGLQRYTGSSNAGTGIDNDLETAGLDLQHRLNESTTIGGQYQFGNSVFRSSPLLGPGTYGYQTHSVQFELTKNLTPRLTLSGGVGPQWVVSGPTGGVTSGLSTSVAANAALNYEAKRYNAALSYVRGVNNGNGVVVGSRLDSLVGSISRPFGRIYSVGGLVGYNHSEQLGNSLLANYNGSAVIAGGQFSAQLRTDLSAFASYTLQRQLFSGSAPGNLAFNGLTQYVTVGITYSPKPFYRK